MALSMSSVFTARAVRPATRASAEDKVSASVSRHDKPSSAFAHNTLLRASSIFRAHAGSRQRPSSDDASRHAPPLDCTPWCHCGHYFTRRGGTVSSTAVLVWSSRLPVLVTRSINTMALDIPHLQAAAVPLPRRVASAAAAAALSATVVMGGPVHAMGEIRLPPIDQVGPDRYCPPRHRMPISSISRRRSAPVCHMSMDVLQR
jgi:hypothetical protein